MKTLALIQGTDSWHEHRANPNLFHASEAPAMMNASSYLSRSALLKQRATGERSTVDAFTQKRFDEGHRYEALARPIASRLIGEPIAPTVGIEDCYSASFDGITIMGDVIWEHKTLNKALAEAMVGDKPTLPLQYRIQIEHQFIVSGAEKCLFMASTWDKDDRLIEERHVWVYPDLELREQIKAGWAQFALDLAAWQPEQILMPLELQALPAIEVRLSGRVDSSNLPVVQNAVQAFIDSINTDLVDDQDFADAEDMVRFCTDTEKQLDAVKQDALAQTADITALFNTLDNLKEQIRDKRLALSKQIKSRKDAIKDGVIAKYTEQFTEFLAQSHLAAPMPDFAGAIKNKKSLSAIEDACAALLAEAKGSATTHAEASTDALSDYDKGFIEGLKAYAWKAANGEYYVGRTKQISLNEAIKQFKEK